MLYHLKNVLISLPVSRKKDLDDALVSMIVKDTQPFTVVEDIGFREFVAKLDPTYILPTRKVCLMTLIKQTTIDDLFLLLTLYIFLPFL